MGPPTLTNEQFLSKAQAKHPHNDHSLVEYAGFKSVIKVVCPVHGEFSNFAWKYLAGTGCQSCGAIRQRTSKLFTQEKFVEEASKRHSNKYDYRLAVYENNKSTLRIICPKHGEFTQRAYNHLNGRECYQCGHDKTGLKRRQDTEEFITKSRLKHGDKYDYSEAVYETNSSRIKIRCPEHGLFVQQAAHHLAGRACPSCAKTGYDSSKPGWLYILKSENTTKVGITNVNVRSRQRDVSNTSGQEFTVIKSWKFSDGSVPENTETLLLKILRKRYKIPNKIFSGYTECFQDVPLDWLLTLTENLLKKEQKCH